MNARERLLTVINGGKPDRLPASVHDWMPYYLKNYLNGRDAFEAYEFSGLDMVIYRTPQKTDSLKDGNYVKNGRLLNKNWDVAVTELENRENYRKTEICITTPAGTIEYHHEANEYTGWLTDRPIRDKDDICKLEYLPVPEIDHTEVRKLQETIGDRGILRSVVSGIGQPGIWQDMCYLHGVENMIMATFDDPSWVHEFSELLLKKRIRFIESLKGAEIDLIEHGGGDASSTVISPKLFEEFVLPYEKKVVSALHGCGLKVVYHTCGGMMPILDLLVQTGADALETLTPPAMGADVILDKVKENVGDKVSLIGGFDQFHGFENCTLQQTRDMVFDCFEKAGKEGGYLLNPSDHFFHCPVENLLAYSDAAKECVY